MESNKSLSQMGTKSLKQIQVSISELFLVNLLLDSYTTILDKLNRRISFCTKIATMLNDMNGKICTLLASQLLTCCGSKLLTFLQLLAQLIGLMPGLASGIKIVCSCGLIKIYWRLNCSWAAP